MMQLLQRLRRSLVRARRLRTGMYRVLPSREAFLDILPRHAVGLELGVFKGEFSERLLETVQPRELHLVDCWWLHYGDFYPDWGAYTEFGRLETRRAYDNARAVTRHYESATDIRLQVADGVEYVNSMPPAYFDWVYLDTSHQFEETSRELAALHTRVKLDGLITGHDWQEDPRHEHHGLCRAVRAFCQSHGWDLVLLDNHSQWALRRRGPGDGSLGRKARMS